ncbi:tetratricopeptide repeat protein [Niabella insulamsoli]|uniref:tetratricopeptide repeat protein n=1 Tax=Niabella insulamsoli TaxID=3144874 RepID=UPI0031FD838C
MKIIYVFIASVLLQTASAQQSLTFSLPSHPGVTAVYSGAIKNGKANGYGEADTYVNGNADGHYKGYWKDNNFHGQGTLSWPDGGFYNGDFVNGLKHGKGTLSWGANNQWKGDKYVGDFVNDQRTGTGTYTWGNGDTYAGGWLNNLRHGYGKNTYANGKVDEGQWQQNIFQGNQKNLTVSNNGVTPQPVSENATELFKRGVDNLNAKKFQEAILNFTEYLRAKPNDGAAYLNRGLCYLEQRKNEAAKTMLEEAKIYIELKPGEAPPKSENSVLAIADFTKALQLDPQRYMAYYLRSEIYRKENDWAAATKDYEMIATLNPDYERYPFLKNISVTMVKNRNTFAENLWIRTLDLGITIGRSKEYQHTLEGDNLAQSIKKTEENEIIYKGNILKLVRIIAPVNYYSYDMRGDCYKALENWASAIADYNDALKLKPDEIYTIEGLADCYAQLGQYEHALAAYGRIIAMPFSEKESYKKNQAYYQRAAIFEKQSKLDAAIAELDEVIANNPKHYAAFFNRGRVYLKKGNKQMARADFVKASQSPGMLRLAQEQIDKLDGKK